MSISTRSMSGICCKRLDGLLAVFGVNHLEPMVLQQVGQGERAPHVVIDQQHLAARQHRVRFPQLAEHAFFRLGQVGFHAVQEQSRLVQQALRRTRVLDESRSPPAARAWLAPRPSALCPCRRRWAAPCARAAGEGCAIKLEPVGIRQPQVEHHAVEAVVAQGLQRFLEPCRRPSCARRRHRSARGCSGVRRNRLRPAAAA